MRVVQRGIIAVLLLCLAGAYVSASAGASAEIDSQTAIAPGVDYITLSDSGPTNAINLVRIMSGAPVELKAVEAPGGLATPGEICRAIGCLAAVNGDFHNVGNGTPVGGVVSDGRMTHEPVADHQQLSIDSTGRFTAGALPPNVVQSLGASYTILSGGQVMPIDEHDAFTEDPQARTLIGWNPAGDTFLVTVDKGSGSRGMTLDQAAELMLRVGATEAVNLDGGRSTQMVVGGELRNVPSAGERAVGNVWAVVPKTAAPAASVPSSAGLIQLVLSLLGRK